MSRPSTPYFDAKAWMPATSAGMTVEIGASDAGNALVAVEQQAGVAGQNPLRVRAERANLSDEFRHARGVADLLRIVGAEDAARRRQLDERRLHRLDLAAHAGGVEHQPLVQIVIEILLRQLAVQRMAGDAPEFL